MAQAAAIAGVLNCASDNHNTIPERIIQSDRTIWLAAGLALLLTLIVGAAVWVFTHLVGALLFICSGLLFFFWYHLRNLNKLVSWTRQPIGTPVPRAAGVWDYVFANLSRRARVSYDQRTRLAQALSRFREASQAMPDGVVYLSDHDIIDWINLAAERHFGLNGEKDVGAPITNLVRQPDFVRYVQADQHSEPLLFRSVRQDGLTLLIQIVPFGEDQRMILSRDITQLDRLENVRRDFVANVSHELKTPLTVVSGFLEMLIDALEEFPPEDAKRYLRLAFEQSGRMQQLVEDLLTLSALESGAPLPQDEKVDAHGLVRAVSQDAQLLSAGRHEIAVELGEPAVLLGSQKELHSALANLASNAVRYTPEGGKVHIRWRVSNDGAEFSVQDTGIGIDAQHIPRLTERFYRVDRGRSRETGGTGLGLAIVKHILTRHQGQLDIHSEPGKGSTFTARFPRHRLQLPE